MNLKDIKHKLIDLDKTMTWLASQLGYSTKHLYFVIHAQNKIELRRIENILKGE